MVGASALRHASRVGSGWRAVREESGFLETMRSGELAREAGVGVETVRFYEREGLLQEPRVALQGRGGGGDAVAIAARSGWRARPRRTRCRCSPHRSRGRTRSAW
ncbi:MAG: MerR family DNA-binding transcriptional regulator [Thermoanaerobaculia bacterium]